MPKDVNPESADRRWREISPYLDQALELEAPARAIWLRELDASAPEIAAEVRALLRQSEQLEAKRFLEDNALVEMARTSLAGQRLGAYTLQSVLGHGGMGTVWLAKRDDGRFEGHAAVKLLNASLLGRPTEQKFVREGSLLAKLRHPNISQLIDAGVAPGGQPYLVLEYVEGERIDRYCEQRQLDIEARVRLFLDVLAAVAHAHSHLIVHRDIKPSNILVTPQGQVKLLDFGVAALLRSGETAAGEMTREVETGFTPEYAAPEQLLFEPVTTATDVYALGLVLFVLLAGRHPAAPEGKSRAEIMRATLDSAPRRLSQFATDPQRGRILRGDLDNIVAKALEKDPAARYTTAESFAQDLRRFLAHEPVLARPDSAFYRAGKFVRRHRGGVATAVVTALVLIGAMVTTVVQMIEARRQRDAAVYQSKRAEFQGQFAYHIMSEVGGDGQPITIKELMERGIDVLEKNYTDDPHFVIGMLINISGRYMDMGDTNGELAALVKAEGIARKLREPDAIAQVQCNTVETELAAGQPQKADARMRDGLANLASTRNPSLERQVECGTAHARLLWSQNKLDEAIDAASDVAKLMQARNMSADVRYFSVVSMLDVMLIEAGRLREEQEWNQRSVEALERLGREGTLTMGAFLSNRARALFAAGEVRAAYDSQRQLVARIESQQGADGVAPGYLYRLGLFQVRLQETDAGLAPLDRAVTVTAAQNNQMTSIAALVSRARAHVELEKTQAALADIETMERLAQTNPQDSQSALQAAQLVRAKILFMQNDAQAALAHLDNLLQEFGYPSRKTAAELGSVLTLKSQVQLALRQSPAALATAQEAVAATTAIAVRPEQSADVGAALMSLAEAQRATGDSEAARASAARAAKALSNGLGENHSETLAALRFGSVLQ